MAIDTKTLLLYNVFEMLQKYFIPTKENKYTPILLKRGIITLYALILLVFNVVTADISALQASAAVDSQNILSLHNQERTKNDLGELKLNSKLVESAQEKAQAMLAANCWDHYCPDGKSPWDFFDEAEYDYIFAGENLAEGFTNNQKVFNAWMNSKTHRDNILRAEFEEIGIAIVHGDFQGISNNAVIVIHFASQSTSNSEGSYSGTQTSQGTPSDITILQPQDGEILNTNTPEIYGSGPDGRVTIRDNSEKIGESICEQGIFTYRVPKESALVDGEHTVEAIHTQQNLSATSTFTVDTIAPGLDSLAFDSIVKENENIITLELTTSEDILSIESSTLELEFTKTHADKWSIQIPKKVLQDLEDIQLTAYDLATNKTDETFNLASIKKDIAKFDRDFEQEESINLPIFKEIGVRRIINIMFIGFIIILMLIDYYALAHIDLPLGVIRTKTQHHLSIFAILLMISIAGGTAGELLEGQQT